MSMIALTPVVYAFFWAGFAWVGCMRFEDWGTPRWSETRRVLPMFVGLAAVVILGRVFGDEFASWHAASGPSRQLTLAAAGALVGIVGYWLTRMLRSKD